MRLYSYSPDVFDFETEGSFYWAGFLAADGNVSDRNLITLSLKESDNFHVAKFRDFIQTNAPVKLYRGSAIARITSKEISGSLRKFNIVPRKTKIYEIPEWIRRHELVRHFVRGYFDGDGWFSLSSGRYSWGICGTQKFVHQIQSIINENLIFPTDTGSISQQKNIFKLAYSSQRQVGKISKFLWGNSSIHLGRKFCTSEITKRLDVDKFDLVKMQYLYDSLGSSHLVSKEMNCSIGTVLKYCNKNYFSDLKGKRISQAKMLNLDKEILSIAYSKYGSIRAVSREFFVSPTTVRKYLTMYGLI